MTSRWDAPLDLFLGARCVGCERGGVALCRECARSLPQAGFVAWPSPTPPGLVTPYAVAPYAGVVRAMILAHKERNVLALGAPLGNLLALAVAHAAPDRGATTLLVPVPSRRASLRGRGHDPMLSITRNAARVLADAGWSSRCAPLLSSGPGGADQSGLDATSRAANVRGSMRVSTRSWRRTLRMIPPGSRVQMIVCDDVLTTGSTAREAQRAAQGSGFPVVAIATVAATRRRGRLATGERSGDSLSPDAARH